VHGGLLNVAAVAAFALAEIGCAELRGAVQPGGEGFTLGNGFGFLGEEKEDGLGDVVGFGWGDEAAGGGVDQMDVAEDEGFNSGAVALEVTLEEMPIRG
jgi:hypothetical protein